MSLQNPDREFMRALDLSLETELAPFGFTRTAKKHLVRQATMNVQTIHLKIQRGRGHLLNCFAVNLEVQDTTAAGEQSNKRRVGSWPYSLRDLPHTLLLSPLSHTLLPLLWVALFTDRWWRIPRGEWLRRFTIRNAVHAVRREIRRLVARSE